MTRVCVPICSSASCNARELMTVASMPMWSAATRSIFRSLAEMPRKMLPPPTTMPTCTPARTTSEISWASSFTRSALMPKAVPPASDSPLSLSRMRLYLDTGFGGRLSPGISRGGVPHLEPCKTRYGDVLAQLGNLGLDQLADRQGVLLDEWLLQQADLFVKLRQPAFDDAVQHLFRLAF